MLSHLQVIAETMGRNYTLLQLAEKPLDDGIFRLDYVVNKESTPDRFMVQIFAKGKKGEFFNKYSKITEVSIAEFNGSEYDIV